MDNSRASSIKVPTGTLFVCLVAVALSTVALPYVTGYGMQLFEVVVLGAWGLVAAVTSGAYADQHHFVVWPVAAVLNVVLFSFLALPLYFIFRRRAPVFSSTVLLAWLIFYVCCLFVLFPGTDGP